jgi:hypothetical protein
MAMMTTLPDPSLIDWPTVTGWVTGIGGVLAAVGVVIWQAIKRAGLIAETLPPAQVDTRIMTADTVAMDRLAGSVEANNAILSENNILRREEHADRSANRTSLEANTRAMEMLVVELRELRQDVKDQTKEIVRANK